VDLLILSVVLLLIIVVVGVLLIAPIRIPLLILIFLCLAVDTPGEGPWESPVAPLGRLLTLNLNKTFPIESLTIPLMAVILICLLLIHLHRHQIASRTDRRGVVLPAGPLLRALRLSFLTLIALCILGIARGGDMQMAKNQVQAFVLLLLMAYLLAMSLRGARDYRLLARAIVVATCIKALMALWVSNRLPESPYMTSHGDSLLFVCAITILFVRFAERPTYRHAILCLLIIPILVAAIIVNNRRLAWVELEATVLMFGIVSRRTRLKRLATQGLLILLPLVLAYVAAGWNSKSDFFAPVHSFRTATDAEDASTLWRDIENYNLLLTLRQNPFLGSGFGHPYVEAIKAPDISSAYKEYRFMPHNSLLGLWGSAGVFGFSGLWAALVVGIFLAARSYRCARSPDERVAAFTALAILVIYEIHCWGDVGFSEKRSIFLVGAALAVAGQLAVSTGGWRPRWRTLRPSGI
jgi:O-antigen ligase